MYIELSITKIEAQSTHPKNNQDGIIRLHGRFINADLQEDTKLPMFIRRQEHFSKLLI